MGEVFSDCIVDVIREDFKT